MTRYGYARVSTGLQSLDTQVGALVRLGIDQHYIEAEQVSGASTHREGLARILRELQAGDELHVMKLDRLGRNMRELHSIAAVLEERGVALVINGQHHDPTTPTGRLLFSLLAPFAEFERDMIAERTAERMAQIRAEGGQLGRPRTTTPNQEAVIARMLEEGYSYRELREATGLSNGTLHRIKKQAADADAVAADPAIARQARKLATDRKKELDRLARLLEGRD